MTESKRGAIAKAAGTLNGASIGTGVAIIAVAFAAFTVAPALVARSAMVAAEAAREDQDRFHDLRIDAEALSGGLLETQTAARGYAATGQVGYAARANEALSELEQQLERLIEDLSAADVDPRLGEAVTAAVMGYVEQRGPGVRALEDRDPAEVREAIAGGAGQTQIDSVRALLNRAESQFAERSAESTAKAETYSDRLKVANIAAVGGTLLTILLAAIYFFRSVRGPLSRLDEAALELGRGNESTRVEPEGAEEIRSLGRSFNQMAEMLQERQAELIAASHAKSEFLARMSHELRTPLNAILGFGQLLEMDHLEEGEADSVKQILRAGRHLLGMIDEVLDISRIESGSLRISMEPVSVATVFGDVSSMTAPIAGDRDVKMTVEPVDPDLHVMADQQRLKQVLLNLLSNGIKYNRVGGELRVRAAVSDRRVRILVTDDGPGIEPEMRDRLFTPFDRLGIERQGHVEGTGLGLALSDRLANLMGGRLTLDETGERGTTFAIELDRVAPPEQTGEPAAPGTRPARERGEVVTVCIEDNASNFELIRRIMEENHEARVYATIQGSIGIDLVREHQPDLVLLDLHLPDISGEEVLARLKGDERTRNIPVIIVSADATTGHQRRLVAAGALAYVTKPLDIKRFLAQVDRALDRERSDA